MFTKEFKFSILLDFYSEILTDRQKELMEYYYNDDLSLSEISDITGLTRQGIRDAIKKGEAKLTELEKSLGLAKRFNNIMISIDEINEKLTSISEKNPDISNEIEEIKERLISLKI